VFDADLDSALPITVTGVPPLPVAPAGHGEGNQCPSRARRGLLCGKKKDDAPFHLRASLM
jgi:hypothetical protein